MSDQDVDGFDPEDFEGIQQKMATLPRAELRRLSAKAKKAEELERQLAARDRETNFIRAGIPEDDLGRMFMKAYEGPEDAEAIKAEAFRLGIVKQPSEQQQQIQQSLAGHEAARELATGAQSAPPGEDLMALMRAATSADEIAQLMHKHGISPDLPR